MKKQNQAQHDLRKLPRGERLDAITKAVISAGTVRIDDLAEMLAVSAMTIHRDLDALDARGVIRKGRGQVTAIATSLVEASPDYRARQNVSAKRAIALAASNYIEPGQAIILADSTTSLHLVSVLLRKQPLTIITNFRRLAEELVGQPGITLLTLGGQYYQWCDAYMGSMTLAALDQLRADVLLMSTPAIIDDVCFHQHYEAAMIKKAMFAAAAKRVLLADHSKFDQRALHAHMPLGDFDVVIVDKGTSPAHVKRLRDKGIDVVIAEEPARADLKNLS